MKTNPARLVFVLFIFLAQTLNAQEVIKPENCDLSPQLHNEADSLKNLFNSKGFIVLREASVTMQSAYELPIVVPMSEGSLYEFVFIGDPGSRLYEVRMYDWDEKQVVYEKKMWGDIDGNIISYAYIPKFSEYHMIKPVQVNNKKKKLCGYIMLLKKVK